MWYVKLQFLFNNISISLIFLFDPASSEKENKFWDSYVLYFFGGKVLDSTLINAFLNKVGSKRKSRNENETSYGLANN